MVVASKVGALQRKYDEANKTKRRVAGSKKESIERKVQKSLRDALSDLTHEEIHCIVVDGMTLIQRLRQDKTVAESGECMDIRFGSCYYNRLRALYQSGQRPEACLVLEKGAAITAALRTAIGRASMHPPVRAPLLAHARAMKSLTKLDATAFLMYMCKVKTGASTQNLQLVMELLKHLMRCNLMGVLPDECGLMRPKFDEWLSQASYASTFATKEGPFTWLESHSTVWPLVLPSTSVMSILNCEDTDKLASVESDIKCVVVSSQIGAMLFGWASSDMEGAAMTDIIESCLGELGKHAAITEKEVASCMADMTESLSSTCPGCMTKKRKSTLVYAGWTIPLEELSVPEEMEVKLVAKLRELAVASECLTKLPVEASLCTLPVSSVKSVTTDHIAKAKASRRFMKRVLDQEEEQNMSGQLVMDQ
eukprot:6458906-Amphidinium_carterae.3